MKDIWRCIANTKRAIALGSWWWWWKSKTSEVIQGRDLFCKGAWLWGKWEKNANVYETIFMFGSAWESKGICWELRSIISY